MEQSPLTKEFIKFEKREPLLHAEQIPVFRQPAMPMDTIISPTLEKDPKAVLSPEKERKNYLESQDPTYIEHLKGLAGQIPEPMLRETKAVACVPVAGHQESNNIYNTIASYSDQTAEQKSFEVLLFVNIPEKLVQEKKAELEKTLSEIQRARADFPELQVRTISAALPDGQVTISNIRKILTDVSLLRQEEIKTDQDVLLLSNDADNEGIGQKYIEEYIKYFGEHPEKDAAVGNLRFDPQAYIRFPDLHMRLEYVTFLDQQGFKNGNVTLFGANSVMKSSIYSAIGGYPPGKRTEQEWTSETIRKVRGAKGALGFVPGALLTTSSRRQVASYFNEGHQTIGFGDEKAESKMRSLDIEDYPIFDYADKPKKRALIAQLESSVNEIISRYDRGEKLGKDAYYYRNNLKKLGIEYEVVGDPKDLACTIKITSFSKFIERQEAMQGLIKGGEGNMAKVFEATYDSSVLG